MPWPRAGLGKSSRQLVCTGNSAIMVIHRNLLFVSLNIVLGSKNGWLVPGLILQPVG